MSGDFDELCMRLAKSTFFLCSAFNNESGKYAYLPEFLSECWSSCILLKLHFTGLVPNHYWFLAAYLWKFRRQPLVASCIIESWMKYMNISTQLQTTWQKLFFSHQKSTICVHDSTGLWKHLKTGLFISQWSYWINLSVFGNVIILSDISNRKIVPNTLLTFILAAAWVLGKSGSFQAAEVERTRHLYINLLNRCQILAEDRSTLLNWQWLNRSSHDQT